jgi:hypothetical protein
MKPDRPVTIDDIQLYIRAELNHSHADLERLFDDYEQNHRIENSSDQNFMIDEIIRIKVVKAIRDKLLEINENLREPKIYRDIAAEKYPKAGIVENTEPREVHQGEWLFGKELKHQESLATVITFDMHWCIVCKKNKSLLKLTHATCDDSKCIAKLFSIVSLRIKDEELSELKLRRKDFDFPYFRLPWAMEKRNKLLKMLKPYLEEL